MKLYVNIEKQLGDFYLKSSFETENEIFAMLGPSGCGKSLTLKCIAGIETPDRGRIVLGEKVLFDSEKKINLKPQMRNIGFLFQDYALFPKMTVKENILLAASDKEYACGFKERFCLQDVWDSYPGEISGGESQRTALARMLAVKPEVLLFDEPFSALDNYLSTRLEHEILDITQVFKGPVVFVSHDRNEVYRLASRIAVMDEGELIDIQEKHDFFDAPKNLASSRLTGCKNNSSVIIKNDKIMATDWGVSIYLKDILIPKETLYIGYRAHYFEYLGKEFKKGDNIISCRQERIIEDTFSVIICFRNIDNTVKSENSLLTWEIEKDLYDENEDDIRNSVFGLRIRPEKLMFFGK